jgi:hypothetical protein
LTVTITEPTQDALPDGSTKVSATIGGQALWFTVPAGTEFDLRGEPFVIAALLPAMLRGEALVGHPGLPICPKLRNNLDQLQVIFHAWSKSLGLPLKIVPIDVPLAEAPPGRGAASFFSGGVDGTYTWLEAPEPLQRAVFIRGVDFQLDNPVYDESFARNAAWLGPRGGTVVSVSTNLRWMWRSFGLPWNSNNGGGLAALAHLLGSSKTYIAGGHNWTHLHPTGSHPITDPLWSSATREIVHHGRVSRWKKLERIAREPGTLEILRVCWQDAGFNCGRCEKCLRTMVLLRLLRLESPNFPPLKDLSAVGRLVPGTNDVEFVEEALELAIARADAPLERALRRSLRTGKVRQWAVDTDRLWLGGGLRRLRRLLRGK